MSKRLERLPSVKDRTGLCTSSIYQGMREGWFPKNFAIGKQARAWDADEVTAWIEAKITARKEAA